VTGPWADPVIKKLGSAETDEESAAETASDYNEDFE